MGVLISSGAIILMWRRFNFNPSNEFKLDTAIGIVFLSIPILMLFEWIGEGIIALIFWPLTVFMIAFGFVEQHQKKQGVWDKTATEQEKLRRIRAHNLAEYNRVYQMKLRDGDQPPRDDDA
ncbi:MAG TPA: hypothetical protein PKA59_04350 [Chakrabartia sp.]|jgi:hypothetical protein|nr:hypothetical protein [Chakrabartia sp.]